MNYEICVIGNKTLLFPFLQFGFATYEPTSDEQLREYLLNAIDKNYGIIYIEDSFCHKVGDILDKYWHRHTPIFIPIGEAKEGESFHQKMITEMMEKAIGMNVL